jgi:hypothetical protein
LMKRLGAPASDDTILRRLKRQVAARKAKRSVRVVDLERREVVDAPPNRSAAVTANWLKEHESVQSRGGLQAAGSLSVSIHGGANWRKT